MGGASQARTSLLPSREVRSEEPSPSRGAAAGAVRLPLSLGVASQTTNPTNSALIGFSEVHLPFDKRFQKYANCAMPAPSSRSKIRTQYEKTGELWSKRCSVQR